MVLNISLPDNPIVYVVIAVLLLVFAYIVSIVFHDVLLYSALVFALLGILAAYEDAEDLAVYFILVAVVAFLLLFVSEAYVSFFDNHQLGQTIKNSGETLINVTANLTKT